MQFVVKDYKKYLGRQEDHFPSIVYYMANNICLDSLLASYATLL